MKNRHFCVALCVLSLWLAAPAAVYAQWLQHTATGAAGTATTAIFPNATGPYTGVVTATATNIHDGANNGVPGILPIAFTNVTPTFNSNWTLNSPGNTFDYLGVTYNDRGDTYTVTLNFTGLQLGYLPAGSVISFLDLDINEGFFNLTALNSSNIQITSNWLTSLGTPFDYNNFGGDGINPNNVTQIGFINGVGYAFPGFSNVIPNQDSAFQGFTLNQNISSLSFLFADGFGPPGSGGYGVAIAVPEPSTWAMMAVGAVMLIGVGTSRRRRWAPEELP